MRTESLFLFCITENEAHLESITGLLGSIKTQEINYNSRGMQILQLQVCAVIFNDVCEPAALLITNILTQSYAHVLMLFTTFTSCDFFKKSLSVCFNPIPFSEVWQNQFKTMDTNQWIKCIRWGVERKSTAVFQELTMGFSAISGNDWGFLIIIKQQHGLLVKSTLKWSSAFFLWSKYKLFFSLWSLEDSGKNSEVKENLQSHTRQRNSTENKA